MYLPIGSKALKCIIGKYGSTVSWVKLFVCRIFSSSLFVSDERLGSLSVGKFRIFRDVQFYILVPNVIWIVNVCSICLFIITLYSRERN
jgi:hypothetical protein